MALLQEYGGGVKGANTYVSVDDFRSYASNYQLNYDGEEEKWLLSAMLYLEQLSFKGEKKSEYQRLQWPRLNVKIDRKAISNASIPDELKDLQCEVAIEIAKGSNYLDHDKEQFDEDGFSLDASPFSHNSKIKNLETKLTMVKHGGMVFKLF